MKVLKVVGIVLVVILVIFALLITISFFALRHAVNGYMAENGYMDFETMMMDILNSAGGESQAPQEATVIMSQPAIATPNPTPVPQQGQLPAAWATVFGGTPTSTTAPASVIVTVMTPHDEFPVNNVYDEHSIVTIQTALNSAGIPTEVDGEYGPTTAKNVTLFQIRNRLETDGVFGSGSAGAAKITLSQMRNYHYEENLPYVAEKRATDGYLVYITTYKDYTNTGSFPRMTLFKKVDGYWRYQWSTVITVNGNTSEFDIVPYGVHTLGEGLLSNGTFTIDQDRLSEVYFNCSANTILVIDNRNYTP